MRDVAKPIGMVVFHADLSLIARGLEIPSATRDRNQLGPELGRGDDRIQ